MQSDYFWEFDSEEFVNGNAAPRTESGWVLLKFP